MAVTLTVGVVTKQFQAGSLEIIENISGRASLSVKVYDSTGSYTPDLNYPLLVDVDATNVFTGVVTGIQTSWPTFGVGKILELEAADHSFLAERMVIKGSTTGGITGRDVADYVVDNYLGPAFGVTRDAGMAAGGTLGALAIDYTKISDVFDMVLRLVAADGWCWRIDEDLVLTAFLPSVGAYPCPFTIEDGDPNMIGDFSVRQVLEEYANKVYFSYNDGTQTPAVVTAENSSLITAHGLYEAAFSTRNELDAATAQSICDGYLTALSHVPVEVKLTTMEAGARAGQTLTIDITNRLAGDFLIHEVRTRTTDGAHVFYDITAMEGAIRKPKYLETYKLWAGVGGTAPPGGSTSISPPPVGGGGGVVIFTKDFEGGGTPTAEGVLSYAGSAGGVGVDTSNSAGLNGTTWALIGTPIPGDGDYPEAGFNLGSPGFGTEREGWAEFFCDFSNLQEFGWTLVAATVGNYTTVNHSVFDLYVGTESGSRYFWFQTGEVTSQTQSSANLFAASTEQLVRVHWRQSTYFAGEPQADGLFTVLIDDVVVWALTGQTIARGVVDTSPAEITRMYFNPCGVLDEIRVGYGAYVPA